MFNTDWDFKDFYQVPWIVYQNDENWVAPFWIKIKNFFKTKNPFWKHADCCLFIAYKDGKPVGRIAAIIDYIFIKKEEKKIGYFGFFECIKDFKIASELFMAAEGWLVSKKMSSMRGPIDGRVDEGCGFLYEGFDYAERSSEGRPLPA